jgi:DNA-binding XRE family transcriptional regulator
VTRRSAKGRDGFGGTCRSLRALPSCQLRPIKRKDRMLPYFRTLNEYPKLLQSLGDHLRKHRLDLGLLQREVAMQLGVAPATYPNWETYDVTPSNEKHALQSASSVTTHSRSIAAGATDQRGRFRKP